VSDTEVEGVYKSQTKAFNYVVIAPDDAQLNYQIRFSTMKHLNQEEIPGDGTTAKLCEWTSTLEAASIPPEILERAKYLILDGIGCGLVGAHVPWSEECASALDLYEPEGNCSVIGYDEVHHDQTR
jgi:hypothetical protein